MKKILILGCSFSAGSHRLKTEDFTPDRPDELVPNSKGWYHYVDHFKDNDITVIACPGHGYWTWYQILLMLDQTNQLKYDEIWIQETSEPRIAILNIRKIEEKLRKPGNFIENIHIKKLGNSDCVTITRPADKSSNINNKGSFIRDIVIHGERSYLNLSLYNPYNFYEELSKTIIKDVQNILKNNKIKSYVWSIRGPIMDAEYVIRLDDMINIIDILEFKELTTGSQLSGIKIHRGGHATEEGNKFIGELINKACINMKI